MPLTLKYLRLQIISLFKPAFQRKRRAKRMEDFIRLMNVSGDETILDLGGHPRIWDSVKQPLDITMLNLPGTIDWSAPTHHRGTYVEGDATNVAQYTDDAFDIVFSNSVIEHVGNENARASFAKEARRLGRSYWVQTPSKYFPIEAHNGMPFWWYYPEAVKKYFIKRWREKLPEWTDMVEGTDIVTRRELETLFPDGEIIVERVWGFPKSYVAYKAPT